MPRHFLADRHGGVELPQVAADALIRAGIQPAEQHSGGEEKATASGR
jgi:hypothetical protein